MELKNVKMETVKMSFPVVASSCTRLIRLLKIMALINVATKSKEMKVCALRVFSLCVNIVFL